MNCEHVCEHAPRERRVDAAGHTFAKVALSVLQNCLTPRLLSSMASDSLGVYRENTKVGASLPTHRQLGEGQVQTEIMATTIPWGAGTRKHRHSRPGCLDYKM